MDTKEVIAKNSLIRISARKLRLVADTVRGKDAKESVEKLKFLNKKGSIYVIKVLESAIANASNNFGLPKDNLYVKEIMVNEGATYKRARMASKGRVRAVLKRTASIYIKLSVKK